MACYKQFSFVVLSLLSLLHSCVSSSNRRLLNYDDPSNKTCWTPGGATWYGNPSGDGSEGGACGYKDAVGKFPWNSMISAGGPSLFKGGKGCGACYQVRCTSDSACSGEAITVVITDECAGGPCLDEPAHFDLSGTALGALAKPCSSDQLRAAGIIKIEYRRVPCFYNNAKLTFLMDAGANAFYLAVLIMYENGDGDLISVEVMQNSCWIPMKLSWGAVWILTSGSPLQPPFSFRLTSSSGKTLVAPNVVPVGWQPGNSYTSDVNF